MRRVPLTYIASSGREYDLKGSILTREANYHIWEWGIDGTQLQYGTRIADFTREAAVYSSTLAFMGGYDAQKDLIDDLHEDFERDVRNKTPGRIIWGDYYTQCFVRASSTHPNDSNTWSENDITIYCPYPFWTRDRTHSFYGRSDAPPTHFLDYDYDYDYDYYLGEPGAATWDTEIPFASEFRLTVFGPVSNPRILINGYPYQFSETLAADEYAVIDSRSNTLIKVMADGRQINIFNSRNKAQSIFEPLPAGTLTINWSGLFGFDLTIFEERSEPR